MNNLFLNDTKVSDIWSLQFMKDLKNLELQNTQVIDLHPLQYLYSLECLFVTHAHVIDVTPLQNLTKLDHLDLTGNKIQSFDSLKHHINFPKQINQLNDLLQLFAEVENMKENEDEIAKYNFDFQKLPTFEELLFNNKIISVHSPHKLIRKINSKNRITKFRNQLEQNQQSVSVMLNNQIMMMNTQLEMLVQFMQNNTTLTQ
ncbi:leucine-rich_repeat domain-containing protein [Hexamita inflata]|uniref:Leucine-rich repeat domain-containing protein n=1 Tax=Hexamita inflata TaxID=28002 RepID=A0AA86UX09_9EUKA|nr:leucine-rich repeat domain-containing protein [Hexamita inflata]